MTKPISQIRDIERHRRFGAARMARYRALNPEVNAANAKRHRRKLKAEVIDHYGGRCACCGESQIEFLAIDHPRGNGKADRREKCNGFNRGGVEFYRKLKHLGFPAGYRVLCHNCNQAIGFYGACPHAS